MELDQEIKMLSEKQNRRQHLSAMLEQLNGQMETLAAREEMLLQNLRKEEADVERLENISLASIFAYLGGHKEQQLDQERSEAMEAAFRLENVQREMESIQRQIDAMEDEHISLQSVDRLLKQKLAEKEQRMLQENPETAEKIRSLDAEDRQMNKQLQEIQEACDAGQAALELCEDILREVKSAENWGVFDMMGGGMLSSVIKHEHLNKAQRQIEELQARLRRFHTELLDVEVRADIEIQTDDMTRFIDVFFDNIWTDWSVMDKISKIQDQLTSTRSRIVNTLEDLTEMEAEIRRRREQVRTRKQQLVAGA